jgi:hypothetical protein
MMIGSERPLPQPLQPGPSTTDTYMQIPQAQLAMMLRTRDADYAALKQTTMRVGIAAAVLGALSIALGIAHLVRK